MVFWDVSAACRTGEGEERVLGGLQGLGFCVHDDSGCRFLHLSISSNSGRVVAPPAPEGGNHNNIHCVVYAEAGWYCECWQHTGTVRFSPGFNAGTPDFQFLGFSVHEGYGLRFCIGISAAAMERCWRQWRDSRPVPGQRQGGRYRGHHPIITSRRRVYD